MKKLVTDALVMNAIVDKRCRVLKDINAKVDNVSVEHLNALDHQIHVSQILVDVVVLIVHAVVQPIPALLLTEIQIAIAERHQSAQGQRIHAHQDPVNVELKIHAQVQVTLALVVFVCVETVLPNVLELQIHATKMVLRIVANAVTPVHVVSVKSAQMEYVNVHQMQDVVERRTPVTLTLINANVEHLILAPIRLIHVHLVLVSVAVEAAMMMHALVAQGVYQESAWVRTIIHS